MYYQQQTPENTLSQIKSEYQAANDRDKDYIERSGILMRLSGPSNKDARKKIHEILTGTKGTVSNSGITALVPLIVQYIKN